MNKPNHILSLLTTIPLFKQLQQDILEEIVAVSEIKEFSAHQIVVQQNEKEVKGIFIVINGLAKNVIQNDQQEEVIIKTYTIGDVFGLIHAMSGEGFAYSIRAMEDTQILFVPMAIFEKLMNIYPAVTEEVAKLVTMRLRELYSHIAKDSNTLAIHTHQHHKKALELMSHPVITCRTNKHIMDISNQLLTHQVSSVVVLDDHHQPIGIVTEKDIIKAFTSYYKNSQQTLFVRDFMTTPLVSIHPEELYYDAVHIMIKHNIRHLPVIDKNHLIGIITMKNLIRSITDHSFTMIKNIEKATNINELAFITKKWNPIITQLLEEHVPAKDITAIITEISDRITRKIIYLMEKEMMEEGFGTPPVAYCWLSFGSEGRKEQALQTDQDNGIVYANVPERGQKETDHYFYTLATRVVNGLEQCGYPKCKGAVMATNPIWRDTMAGWQKKLHLWSYKREPEMMRNISILVDFRMIYGDTTLAEELKDQVFSQHHMPPLFLHLLAEDLNQIDVGISRFGRFVTEKGKHSGLLDIKHHGLMQIVNGLRLYTLKHGIHCTNSWERLARIKELGIITADEKDEVFQALDDLMLIRIKHTLNQLKKGQELIPYFNPNQLSKKERLDLKRALMTARWFKSKTIRYIALPGSPLRGL